MTFEDFRTTFMGICWLFFGFAPLFLSMLAGRDDCSDRPFAIFIAIVSQIILIVSIGHSWK